MKAIPILSIVVLHLLFSTPTAAQVGTLRVTITSDNAYLFGFGDAEAIDPATVAGAVFSGMAKDIYGARVWDVQANGGALPPRYGSVRYGPERYTLPGDIGGKYIYIVSWSDNAAWQGTIALFEDAATGFRCATGPDSPWEVYATGRNLDARRREYPSLADVNAQIAVANAKAGTVPGSVGWVNTEGCADGTDDCRGTLLHCTEFTEARIAGFPDIKTNFGAAQFMWYRNPDYPNGSCDVETTPAELSGEYLIFRLGPIDEILRPCDSIGLRLEANPENPCCAQALLRNSALSPWYAVRLRILTEDVTFADFQATGGWSIDEAISGQQAVAQPPGGIIPLCNDASCFAFCLAGPDSIDARIELSWVAGDSAMCRDTLTWSCERAVSATGDIPNAQSSGLRILGCSPEPVRENGIVRFTLEEADAVRIDLYDLLGRQRGNILDARCDRGTHAIGFSTTGLPAGSYLLRMTSGDQSLTAPIRIVR
jgi:hypothetical protein